MGSLRKEVGGSGMMREDDVVGVRVGVGAACAIPSNLLTMSLPVSWYGYTAGGSAARCCSRRSKATRPASVRGSHSLEKGKGDRSPPLGPGTTACTSCPSTPRLACS